jgi:hypothetical protein
MGQKYFLAGASSITEVLGARQLASRRQIRNGHIKTYATKDFWLFA